MPVLLWLRGSSFNPLRNQSTDFEKAPDWVGLAAILFVACIVLAVYFKLRKDRLNTPTELKTSAQT